MKKFSLLLVFLTVTGAWPLCAEQAYLCKFEKEVPYGVSAWSQSERVRNGIGKETRFMPYPKGAAGELTNDALVERGGEAEEASDPRETAFYQAYDEKGWSIYIESREPLVEGLLNELVDSRSAGHKESYEVFFTPGLQNVPYYQVFINPYQNKVQFYDWGMPHEDYRSLKESTWVESLPLKNGVGTFIFIPWHLLYERAPLEGGEWRFTIIRWMPFSKAGGVTWGGRVHETGRFGLVRFEKPSPEQRQAMERRLLRYAWFKFKAVSDELSEFWSDPHLGDPEFYDNGLAPEIQRLTAVGEAWGNPEEWTPAQVRDGMVHLKALMEVDYKAAALRNSYLRQKRIAGK